MSDETRYRLEVTERQLALLSRAADLLARIHMGQLDAVAGELMWHGKPPGDHSNWAGRMHELDDILDRAQHLVSGFTTPGSSWGIASREISDDARAAFDVHRVLRHRLYWDRNPEGPKGWPPVDSDEPRRLSETQPLATVERIADDGAERHGNRDRNGARATAEEQGDSDGQR